MPARGMKGGDPKRAKLRRAFNGTPTPAPKDPPRSAPKSGCPRCGGVILENYGERSCLACGWEDGRHLEPLRLSPQFDRRAGRTYRVNKEAG